MMSRFNIIIAVLSLLGLQTLAAAQLSLTAKPSVVMDGLTDTLTMRCSLQVATISEASEILTVSNISNYAKHVNSIKVYRGVQAQSKDKILIASITGSYPAEANSDKENLKVEGVLSPNAFTDPSYLELVWTEPRKRQKGLYTCLANVVDTFGRSKVLQEETDVTVEEPNIPELVNEIQNLKNQTKVLEARHAEQGQVLCTKKEWRNVGNNHQEINKSVHFNKPYTDLPVVETSVVSIDIDQKYNARYYIEVRDLNISGFTLTCGTWSDSDIFQLGVQWISTDA